MPFTPYHFGPAFLAKGLLKQRFCIVTFALSQFIIDLESFYFLVQGVWPVHRFLHSYLGATVAILITLALAKPIQRILNSRSSWVATLTASIFGGYSHVVLDSIMHTDIKPFYPLSDSNSFLRLMDLPMLHNFCIYSGIIGLGIMSWSIIRVMGRK